MAIKDVVCVLDIETDLTTATVQIASELAAKMDAHLTGVAPLIEPVVPALMVQPVPDQFITDARNRAKEKAESAIERFSDYAKVNNLPFETRILGHHARRARYVAQPCSHVRSDCHRARPSGPP